jgi:hypothetical protein
MTTTVSVHTLPNSSFTNLSTERSAPVAHIPASYSADPRLKSQHRYQLSWLDLVWFSSVFPHKCRDSILKLGHSQFLAHFSNSSFTYTILLDAILSQKSSLNYKLQNFPPFDVIVFELLTVSLNKYKRENLNILIAFNYGRFHFLYRRDIDGKR